MIGAKAAAGTAHGARGNGLAAELRPALLERLVGRYRERAVRTRAEQLARMTWIEDARHEHADAGPGSRDTGATPLRWTRLT